MEKIGIFYGSTTGETETVAGEIAKIIGEDKVDVYNVAECGADDIKKYDNLILGTSTMGIGELQEDWESFIENLNFDFSEKKVALFGLGDQEIYIDTFADALGILYEKVKGQGANIIGFTTNEGFEFDESKAYLDGKFVGLVIDQVNQEDLTENRIKNWVDNLINEF